MPIDCRRAFCLPLKMDGLAERASQREGKPEIGHNAPLLCLGLPEADAATEHCSYAVKAIPNKTLITTQTK